MTRRFCRSFSRQSWSMSGSVGSIIKLVVTAMRTFTRWASLRSSSWWGIRSFRLFETESVRRRVFLMLKIKDRRICSLGAPALGVSLNGLLYPTAGAPGWLTDAWIPRDRHENGRRLNQTCPVSGSAWDRPGGPGRRTGQSSNLSRPALAMPVSRRAGTRKKQIPRAGGPESGSAHAPVACCHCQPLGAGASTNKRLAAKRQRTIRTPGACPLNPVWMWLQPGSRKADSEPREIVMLAEANSRRSPDLHRRPGRCRTKIRCSLVVRLLMWEIGRGIRLVVESTGFQRRHVESMKTVARDQPVTGSRSAFAGQLRDFGGRNNGQRSQGLTGPYHQRESSI